jgi:hypothetical protein
MCQCARNLFAIVQNLSHLSIGVGNSVVIIASHRGELKLGLVSRIRILAAAISGLMKAAAAIGCLMANPIGGLAAAIAVMLTTAATLSSQAAVVLSILQSSA